MSTVVDRMRFWLDHRWAPPHMSDYLDAGLSSGRRQRMERHVGECHECRRLLASLRVMLRALHGLPAPAHDLDAARMAESVRLRLGERQGRD